jgi:hypothetical protein
MNPPPSVIAGADVLSYAIVDAKVRWTKGCTHLVAGEIIGPADALAICHYSGKAGYYLFYCDAAWRTVADGWHESLEAAKCQAEFEYQGIGENWRPIR